MSFEARISSLVARYKELKDEISKPFENQEEYIKISKEIAEMDDYIGLAEAFKKDFDELQNLSELLKNTHNDSEISDMIADELHTVRSRVESEKEELKLLLVPKDPNDSKNVILEVRAGTGGDEAGLFARDLFRMYQRFAEIKNWKFEVMYINENDFGSLREAAANISGKNVYSTLKFESGVHRVQRVPLTEASGRIHTSTATVAIMPEVEEVDFELDPKDLRIEVMRASGAGGQHVNRTESAVRITHIPTNIVVVQQDERSQHMNKAKAMRILRARVYDLELQKRNDEIASDRRSKIGTGERSERIRTYNFPQGRVTDHRINLTLYKIDQIMNGELQELVDALRIENLKELVHDTDD